jgi:hypothetical protein
MRWSNIHLVGSLIVRLKILASCYFVDRKRFEKVGKEAFLLTRNHKKQSTAHTQKNTSLKINHIYIEGESWLTDDLFQCIYLPMCM